ncbi:MAG TPA: tyrosine-type recombinase/integrase [Acetobacteraceae bacterium]|jgi:integrase|nr:tyrosine-type recombinase/integrase [Acetobacteraceae bacterium]
MPISTLTPTAIAAASRRAAGDGTTITLKDAGQTGLELRIAPSGKRVWSLQCRDAAGQPRRFTVGQHPALGLGKAREECRALRERVRQGADPVVQARKQREAARNARDGVGTLAALIETYERHQGRSLKSWPECRRRIESVFAKHLKRPLAGLTLEALQHTADNWPSGQSAAAAVRYIRPMLKWAAHANRAAVARELALITPPATVARRQRVLNHEELARLLPTLRASHSAYAAALQFMLLTCCRREEASTALWQDIDLQARLWRLPETKTKNGQEHAVPLSRQALALLRSRLPADNPDPAARVFTSDGGKLGNWDRATKVIMVASDTQGWHRHDLRRTAATMMGEMGIDPHVIEAALAHKSVHSQLASIYNAARYRPQVADALQRLADALDNIEHGSSAEVIRLPAR